MLPADAIIRMSATCVCGSDLWPYRGIEPITRPTPMGHEYCGIVEEVGSAVKNVKPGQFVVGSFFASDNTCPICLAGYQSRCVHNYPMGAEGAQAELLRVPLADGTLVATPDLPSDDLIPSLLATSAGLARWQPRQAPAQLLSSDPILKGLKDSKFWPRSNSTDPETGEYRSYKDKAEAHGAAYFTRYAAPGDEGYLQIRQSVFLPVGDPLETLDIAGGWSYDVTGRIVWQRSGYFRPE